MDSIITYQRLLTDGKGVEHNECWFGETEETRDFFQKSSVEIYYVIIVKTLTLVLTWKSFVSERLLISQIGFFVSLVNVALDSPFPPSDLDRLGC